MMISSVRPRPYVHRAIGRESLTESVEGLSEEGGGAGTEIEIERSKTSTPMRRPQRGAAVFVFRLE